MHALADWNVQHHKLCLHARTRVLTRVQLTSGREPSSNSPMHGCRLSQSGLQSGLGAFTLEANLVEFGLELSCKRGYSGPFCTFWVLQNLTQRTPLAMALARYGISCSTPPCLLSRFNPAIDSPKVWMPPTRIVIRIDSTLLWNLG